MGVIVGLIYFAVLSLVLTYAVGGVGLGIAVFVLLAYMLGSELVKAYVLGNHPEEEEHRPGQGHHVQ